MADDRSDILGEPSAQTRTGTDMELIDTHCHLDDSRFDTDRDEVVARAEAACVSRQIIPSTTAERWPLVRDICLRHPGLYPAFGLHPMFTNKHLDIHLERLETWVISETAVAVGECGLDYFIPSPDRPRQRTLFRRQIEIAVKQNLPLIIHARRSVEESIQILKEFPDARGVFHSYSGSLQQALQLADRGFLMSFGGPVTFDRATRLRSVATQLPSDAIMLESDAPDQPDFAHKGGRNEPAFITSVLRTLSELRNQPEEELAAATTANARGLFRL